MIKKIIIIAGVVIIIAVSFYYILSYVFQYIVINKITQPCISQEHKKVTKQYLWWQSKGDIQNLNKIIISSKFLDISAAADKQEYRYNERVNIEVTFQNNSSEPRYLFPLRIVAFEKNCNRTIGIYQTSFSESNSIDASEQTMKLNTSVRYTRDKFCIIQLNKNDEYQFNFSFENKCNMEGDEIQIEIYRRNDLKDSNARNNQQFSANPLGANPPLLKVIKIEYQIIN